MISDFKFRVRRSDIKDARMMIIEDFQQIGDCRDILIWNNYKTKLK